MGEKAEAAKKEILEIEKEKVAGLVGADSGHAGWVERYDSSSIIQVNPDGSTLTKAQHVAELRSGDSKVLTMHQYQHELHVYNDGNTVVVTNRASGGIQKHGKVSPVESRFTDVWVTRRATSSRSKRLKVLPCAGVSRRKWPRLHAVFPTPGFKGRQLFHCFNGNGT